MHQTCVWYYSTKVKSEGLQSKGPVAKSPLFTLWRCLNKKSIWNETTITRFLIQNCPEFFLANNVYKNSSQEKLVLKFLEHAAHCPTIKFPLVICINLELFQWELPVSYCSNENEETCN